jgi:hypothetical protein
MSATLREFQAEKDLAYVKRQVDAQAELNRDFLSYVKDLTAKVKELEKKVNRPLIEPEEGSWGGFRIIETGPSQDLMWSRKPPESGYFLFKGTFLTIPEDRKEGEAVLCFPTGIYEPLLCKAIAGRKVKLWGEGGTLEVERICLYGIFSSEIKVPEVEEVKG